MIRDHLRSWPSAVFLFWAIVSAALVITMRESILGGWVRDPDDYMRIMQVRDWLAGQSWYDVNQHRMNPPLGGIMHWTRLIDLPIAAGLTVLRPLLGTAWAEIATMTAVPLLLLLATMLTLGWTAKRLADLPGAAGIGPVLMLFSPLAVLQFMPLRIDHHSWQILMAAAAAAGLLMDRQLRGGLIAGLALGFWVTISIEGLPFAAMCLGAAGLRWALVPRQGVRLAACSAALAASASIFFLVTTPPHTWGTTNCDAIGPAHLANLAIAAVGIFAAVRLLGVSTPRRRLASLAAAAGVAGAAVLTIAPFCADGPFSRLDPLAYRFWYLNITEGLPVWRQRPQVVIQILFLPIAALIGSLAAWRRAEDHEQKGRWLVMTILILGSFLTSLLVMRAAGVATVMAIPGALVAIAALVERARRAKTVMARSLGTTLAVLLPTPLTPAIAIDHPYFTRERERNLINAVDSRLKPGLDGLAALPRTILFAPIDVSPMIMARTGHYVIASGYHRNDRAMADVIRVFTGPVEQARLIILRHRAAYLVSIGAAEERNYRYKAPDGLAARLAADRPPAWLRPVPMPAGQLKVWRVIP